jgi:hypothetical protein
MTLAVKQSVSGSATQTCYLYYLVNPALGANTVSVSFNSMGGALYLEPAAISYNGASQTGIDNTASQVATVTAYQNLYTSLTTTADNAWGVVFAANQGFYASGSLPTTKRQSSAFADAGMGDTNAAVTPPGTLTVNTEPQGNGSQVVVLVSFAPYVAVATTPTPHAQVILNNAKAIIKEQGIIN